jgi:hypothetical protein
MDQTSKGISLERNSLPICQEHFGRRVRVPDLSVNAITAITTRTACTMCCAQARFLSQVLEPGSCLPPSTVPPLRPIDPGAIARGATLPRRAAAAIVAKSPLYSQARPVSGTLEWKRAATTYTRVANPRVFFSSRRHHWISQGSSPSMPPVTGHNASSYPRAGGLYPSRGGICSKQPLTTFT